MIEVEAHGIIEAEGSTADSITLSDVHLEAGGSSYIFILSDGGAPSSVEWGTSGLQHSAVLLGNVLNSTSGLTASAWRIKYIKNTETQDLVATWASTNSERLLACVQVKEGTVLDISIITNTQVSSTAPTTGTAGTSLTADTSQIAFFGSNGRASDTLGTVGEGHTSLESGGTVAAGVHAHITYEILSATGDVRGAKTGATSRDWSNIIICLKKRQIFDVTVSVPRNWHQNHKPNYVWVSWEDESGQNFEEPLDPYFFDKMSDEEFRDWRRYICTIWAANNLDSEYDAESDTARAIRIATFSNEQDVI